MPQILRVKRTAVFREGSVRARWYERLLAFNGQPVDAFIANAVDKPPATPDSGQLKGKLEPVGWLRFFRNEGLLEIEETGEKKSTTFPLSG